MAKAKTTIRVVTPDKKCPVCNGPARVPSGFEMASCEGAVELAQAVTAQERGWLHDNLDNQAYGTHEVQAIIDKLVEAARLQGAQEARLELVTL